MTRKKKNPLVGRYAFAYKIKKMSQNPTCLYEKSSSSLFKTFRNQELFSKHSGCDKVLKKTGALECFLNRNFFAFPSAFPSAHARPIHDPTISFGTCDVTKRHFAHAWADVLTHEELFDSSRLSPDGSSDSRGKTSRQNQGG